jgi:very-short-patch-repair endonuclease
MKKEEMTSGVIFLQKVNDFKISQARELRRDMTAAEKILWNELRNRKFKGLKFRRQQIIEGFIVDFFCHERRLVVEVDGEIHDNPEQILFDKHKDAVLLARGLHILRVKNAEVFTNLKNVLVKIQNI